MNDYINIQTDPIYGNYPKYDEDGNKIRDNVSYELTDLEKLCFKCPLSDCKENSKKCLIKQAKAK